MSDASARLVVEIGWGVVIVVSAVVWRRGVVADRRRARLRPRYVHPPAGARLRSDKPSLRRGR